MNIASFLTHVYKVEKKKSWYLALVVEWLAQWTRIGGQGLGTIDTDNNNSALAQFFFLCFLSKFLLICIIASNSTY